MKRKRTGPSPRDAGSVRHELPNAGPHGDFENHPSRSALEQIFALCDGIFAIAMTLLVLGLVVPELPHATNQSLTEALLRLWPNVAAYALGFCTLYSLWTQYNFVIRKLKRVDTTLMLLNGLLLMAVAFIPFMTGVMGRYPSLGASAVLYGITLSVVTWTGTAVLAYARRHNLVEDRAAAFLQPVETQMFLLSTVFVAVGTLALVLSPIVSYVLFWLWNICYWTSVRLNRRHVPKS